MAKFPARLDDLVSNSTHGSGQIITGHPSVTFEGKPIACAGDLVNFADSTQGIIAEGNACVVVNGKRVALLEDKIVESGVISSSASTIQIDEGEPFVFIGPNVSIGQNVRFTCKPKQAYNQHFILYHDGTGEPLPHTLYQITTPQGVFAGITDAQGRTAIIGSNNADEINIDVFE